jgi:putative transposase
MRKKCDWCGSELVEADRFYPSSNTCHHCGHVQTIGWTELWTCRHCTASHQRDDNATINLTRWPSMVDALGSVGAR